MASASSREHWGSSFGFIMAAAGSAIGLGNVWKFPYITGMNGGGAFVLVYLFCVLLVGLPVMLAEFAIGRASQSDPIGAFAHFAKKNSMLPKIIAGGCLGAAGLLFFNGLWGLAIVAVIFAVAIYHYGWKVAGFTCSLVPLVILAYYAMIGGWIFYYALLAFSGKLHFTGIEQAGERFASVASNGFLCAGLTIVFLLFCAAICWFGVKKGLETGSKIMMPLLFVLILFLVVRGLTLEGAEKGLRFFLEPKMENLSRSGVLEAMGHSFFTLSLGMGILITYGSYLPKRRNILSSALWIVLLDTLIAILAGLAIFPAVFAAGMNPGAGPGLIFKILPVTFQAIPGGFSWFWNGIFFSLMFLAALTSGMSLLETGIASCMTHGRLSRKTAVLTVTAGVAAFGILISFGVTSWEHLTALRDLWIAVFGHAKDSFFDQVDYICSSWILPLNGLAAALYAGWVWGVGKATRELYRSGQPTPRLYDGSRALRDVLMRKLPIGFWAFFIRFIAPFLVLVTFLYAAGFFHFAA